ncbi:UDP-N-acetylmuramate dehydrogenase [Murinocardiopsis flavida]|uniref:UDP-N-acetylenolpyruvoylglucosamine reductase n=1 Tax=Murinocardiopsis flavida TaxID=645275 RepID=A0A2P8D6K8_9ACTN|nr:UDP-N-acetylmuramate dehydrogenase [Murinocardiopsis flavida]PSK92854.1 UDP-N-acetylmuramate dehydrogenase [Murinocardiopsis flavida]
MSATARQVPLSDYTTLRLGGPAAVLRRASDTESLVAAVRAADAEGIPLLVLGGGSNLVIADSGFPGTVVHVDSPGVRFTPGEGDTVRVAAEAGVDWDSLVERCTAEGLSGIECLSGIPGRVGSTPIQNVGAYGQDVSETISTVRVYDRRTGELRTLTGAECGFAYRDSAFKGDDRFIVCEVAFDLTRSPLSRPIAYAELARRLGVEPGDRVPLAAARAAVLELRKGKGMVLDPGDPDTRSAGSFFTNPILGPDEFTEFTKRAAERLGPDLPPPGFAVPDGRTKTSAAWLIEKAGFRKGFSVGPARISTKHTLALTNPGGATTADLLDLARTVRAGVAEAFGVTLVNEPVMVGTSL